jgi:hypothetical protein
VTWYCSKSSPISYRARHARAHLAVVHNIPPLHQTSTINSILMHLHDLQHRNTAHSHTWTCFLTNNLFLKGPLVGSLSLSGCESLACVYTVIGSGKIGFKRNFRHLTWVPAAPRELLKLMFTLISSRRDASLMNGHVHVRRLLYWTSSKSNEAKIIYKLFGGGGTISAEDGSTTAGFGNHAQQDIYCFRPIKNLGRMLGSH